MLSLSVLFIKSVTYLGATLIIGSGSEVTRPTITLHRSPVSDPGAVSAATIDGPYLFIDESLIDAAKSSVFELKVHPPEIRGRVVEPDAPWEAMGYHYWSQVREFDHGYRLYYRRVPVDDADEAGRYCVAHSADGVNWEKPLVEGVRFRGQQTNCTENGYQFVLFDPNNTTSAPFKKLGQLDDGAFGITGSSSDGLDFDRKQVLLLPFFVDTQNVVLWDDVLDRYVFFLRGRIDEARTVVRGEAATLKGMLDITPEPGNVATPGLEYPPIRTELPLVLAADARDWQGWQDPRPGMVDIYHSAAFKYPWSRNVYLAFPDIYYHYSTRTTPPAIGLNDGEFEVQLATSRDGVSWTRQRTPFVARGVLDEVQMYMVSMGQGMVRRGNELYQYFIALPRSHGYGANLGGEWRPILENEQTKMEWMNGDRGGVYLAVSQLHRFVSLHADETERLVTTKPFSFQGARLTLNFRTEGEGWVCASLLDKAGRELAGYGLGQCDRLQGDEFEQVVSWQGQSDLSALSGEEIRLRLRFRQVDVFAFEFRGDSYGQTPLVEEWREDFAQGFGEMVHVNGRDLWSVEDGVLAGPFDRDGALKERARLLDRPMTQGDAFAFQFDFRLVGGLRVADAAALVGLMGDGRLGRNPLLAVWLDDGGRKWGISAGADASELRLGGGSKVGPDLALWPNDGDWLRARLLWNPNNQTATVTLWNLNDGSRIGGAEVVLAGIRFTLDRVGVRMDMPTHDPDLALEMDNFSFWLADQQSTPTPTVTSLPPTATATATATATVTPSPVLTPSPTVTSTQLPSVTPTPTATPAGGLLSYLPLWLAAD